MSRVVDRQVPWAPFALSVVVAFLVSLGVLFSPVGEPRVAFARTCPTISGYVYHDGNGNGLRDPGEAPIGGSRIQLYAADGSVVNSTMTDGDGYYEFFFDATARAPEEVASVIESLPPRVTNWSDAVQLPPFDSQLGTLVSVGITVTATITSAIEAESLDSESTTVTATVSGQVAASSGGHTVIAVPEVQAGQFAAAPYDGEPDYAGSSGHNFGEHSASDTATTILEGADLDAFREPGPVTLLTTAEATSNTTGSGNVLNHIETTASIAVSLTYHYTPYTCLLAATYTIVQEGQPAGYADGRETRGNQVPLPGSAGSDVIPVNLGGVDLSDNNFGELTGSLAGNVYVDLNDDGIFASEELPIAGVRVRLFGTNVREKEVDLTLSTLSDGSYRFSGLLTGDYQIREAQPAGYLDGRDTIGSQGGDVENDGFIIPLAPGSDGVENNFGELLPPTPTSTPPDVTATALLGATATVPTAMDLATGTPPPGQTTTVPESRGTAAATPGAPGAGLGLAVGGRTASVFLALLLIAVAGVGLLVFGSLTGSSRRRS